MLPLGGRILILHQILTLKPNWVLEIFAILGGLDLVIVGLDIVIAGLDLTIPIIINSSILSRGERQHISRFWLRSVIQDIECPSKCFWVALHYALCSNCPTGRLRSGIDMTSTKDHGKILQSLKIGNKPKEGKNRGICRQGGYVIRRNCVRKAGLLQGDRCLLDVTAESRYRKANMGI
jgi:hypothetical protein